MYCRKCGQEVDGNSKFCPNCGAPVDANAQPSTKKPPKPIFKRWWFWAIIVFVVFCILSSIGKTAKDATLSTEPLKMSEAEPTETIPIVTTAATVNTPESSETTAEPTEASDATVDPATIVSLIETTLKGNFENCDVSYKDGIITINLWQDGLAAGAMLAQAGNDECLDSWNEVVENQKDLCLSIVDFVETFGITDIPVSINVLNDLNKENVLLSILNGVVIYNALS